ncbi:DinB family protein [Ktedonospora formicarum]|uniref:Damage-inducible protein DinB n=1 Tax=Ktedonospora formicarum TaxID=2778364 RepID=A0A8J3MXA0_9CHLR|nr:DinB family protein [Ktedonospora formicarum]GHO49528.1 hypothetical protein KSX_76910 [Ktedonospora formicarum]
MTEHAPSLLTFYQGWQTYQQSLIEVIEPLSSEQLALSAGSHQWTVGMLAQHIIANRVWWFQAWMGEGNPDLAPIAHWDPSDEVEVSPRNTAELVAGLKSTWDIVATALGKWNATNLDYIVQPPATLKEEERPYFPPHTRQWIIWHTLEHEIHHGGELSFILGEHGLPGIYGNF